MKHILVLLIGEGELKDKILKYLKEQHFEFITKEELNTTIQFQLLVIKSRQQSSTAIEHTANLIINFENELKEEDFINEIKIINAEHIKLNDLLERVSQLILQLKLNLVKNDLESQNNSEFGLKTKNVYIKLNKNSESTTEIAQDKENEEAKAPIYKFNSMKKAEELDLSMQDTHTKKVFSKVIGKFKALATKN